MRTGQAKASSIAGSAILASAFDALPSDELFDSAVDFLVDLIHETQELDDNVTVIQEIVPRLTLLKDRLLDPATRDDEDRMRGYCRILVEAGEWYEPLIVNHQDTFLPLVQAIAECANYDNLDIVGITLNFWYRLARGLRSSMNRVAPTPAILEVFSNLVSTIIRHLHYPDDDATLQGQERDDFRNFRHMIGDTLKDCCGVLGATNCLRKSFDIISAKTQSAAVKWQDIEAPLFSMRTMGAEVDPRDDEIMPQIMALLPKLPPHPKIKYAAILVIGRYTQWIDCHPEHIQFQLPYISSGFEATNEPEVSAAAAQAMKYLCKDCSRHLVPYLPQLHLFLQTVTARIGAEDLLDLAAAMAHIIVVMPSGEQARALSSFVMPDVELVHALANKPAGTASKQDLRTGADALERIDMYLAIVEQLPDGVPPECIQACSRAWTVFDQLLAQHGSSPLIVEKTCVAIRRGLQFLGETALPLAADVLNRLTSGFDKTHTSSYLWITSKLVAQFSRSGDTAVEAAIKDAVERDSQKVLQLLQGTAPAQMPDGECLIPDKWPCPAALTPNPLLPQSWTTTFTSYTTSLNTSRPCSSSRQISRMRSKRASQP